MNQIKLLILATCYLSLAQSAFSYTSIAHNNNVSVRPNLVEVSQVTASTLLVQPPSGFGGLPEGRIASSHR